MRQAFEQRPEFGQAAPLGVRDRALFPLVYVARRDRGRFPRPPEDAYASTTICVAGTVETTPDGLGMEVESPGSIAVP